MLEGSFPASGSLSGYAEATPFCLQWICNRAMTDFEKRYTSAREMLRDIEDLLASPVEPLDEVKVSSLSSFRGTGSATVEQPTSDSDGPEEPLALVAVPSVVDVTSRGRWPPALRVSAVAIAIAGLLGAGGAVAIGWGPVPSRGERDASSDRPARTAPRPIRAVLSAPHRVDAASLVFADRAGAVHWFVGEAESMRHREGGPAASFVLVPRDLADVSYAGEFLRELKLALAHQSIPFETRAEVAGGSRAATHSPLKPLHVSLSYDGTVREWSIAHP